MAIDTDRLSINVPPAGGPPYAPPPSGSSGAAVPPPAGPEKHCRPEPVEPIIWLLVACTVFFALVLIMVSKISPNDGQTFQAISVILGNFSGALFVRVKLSGGGGSDGTPRTGA